MGKIVGDAELEQLVIEKMRERGLPPGTIAPLIALGIKVNVLPSFVDDLCAECFAKVEAYLEAGGEL